MAVAAAEATAPSAETAASSESSAQYEDEAFEDYEEDFADAGEPEADGQGEAAAQQLQVRRAGHEWPVWATCGKCKKRVVSTDKGR